MSALDSQDARKITLDDLANITDYYFPNAQGENPLEDAFCYHCDPRAIALEGSALHTHALTLLSAALAQKKTGGAESRVTHEGAYYRPRWMDTIHAPTLHLRTIPPKTPELDDLIMPPLWPVVLRHPMDSGLNLFVAKTGQGKTTLMSATILTQLLEVGGFCHMIEDPPEHRLQGLHGHGICFQTPVTGSWEQTLAGSMRFYPSIACEYQAQALGEIRDSDSAAHVLHTAVNGQRVYATVHSDSIEGGIDRIATLATRRLGTDQAYALLASALRVVIHQQLEWLPEGSGFQRARLRGSILYLPESDKGTRTQIRERKLSGIADKVRMLEGRFSESQRQRQEPDAFLRGYDQGDTHALS